MKEIIHELLTGLARWPLLMGAVVCFGFAVYEEMVTDNTEVLLGVGGLVVGCVLLGGWLVSYIVAGEREHYAKRQPKWVDESSSRIPLGNADRVPDGLLDQRPDHE